MEKILEVQLAPNVYLRAGTLGVHNVSFTLVREGRETHISADEVTALIAMAQLPAPPPVK